MATKKRIPRMVLMGADEILSTSETETNQSTSIAKITQSFDREDMNILKAKINEIVDRIG